MKIEFRSSWERLCMIWFDETPGIIAWNSEGVKIPYIDQTDNRPHKYHVDFWIQTMGRDGQIKEALIEVKPEKQCRPPRRAAGKTQEVFVKECRTYLKNQSKWKAARAFCDARGLQWMVITDKTLKVGRYKNKK